LDEVREGKDWRITASHDGYEKRFGVRHQRTIAVHTGGFLIEDRLLGGARMAAIIFQFAPDLAVSIDDDSCLVWRDGEKVAAFSFDSAGHIAVGRGLVSPAFGTKLEAPRLVWTGEVDKCGARVRVTQL
jgi:hypothetical protein